MATGILRGGCLCGSVTYLLVLGSLVACAPTANRSAASVSLAELIGTPERFDGMQVGVSGFIDLDENGDFTLYLSEADYRGKVDGQAISGRLQESIPWERDAENPSGRRVMLEGQFLARDPIRNGSPTLTEVSRVWVEVE